VIPNFFISLGFLARDYLTHIVIKSLVEAGKGGNQFRRAILAIDSFSDLHHYSV
jgi:hypothetical protein